jgi:hypothetical protein
MGLEIAPSEMLVEAERHEAKRAALQTNNGRGIKRRPATGGSQELVSLKGGNT